MKTCAECRFSHQSDVNTDLTRQMECRKNPPQVVILPSRTGDLVTVSVFPPTTPNGFCYGFGPMPATDGREEETRG